MWQKLDTPCPICNSLLSESFDYMDDVLMEHHQECDNCKDYSFSYVTGGTQVFIGSDEWTWYYDTPHEEIENLQADIDSVVCKMRQKI